MAGGVTKHGCYAVEEICPGVYAIDSPEQESMYLVCGRDKAVMIDTGSNPEPVLPVVRTLWQGPVSLVLTHAHFDHMYHCDEFAEVRLGAEDKAAWSRVLGPIVWVSTLGSGKKPKRYPMGQFKALHHGDSIDLGGKCLRVIAGKGHTPGSILLADEPDRCLFTGDAFGSGSFAWMWMPGCSPVGEYLESLRCMERELEPYRDYTMLGGHRRQGIPSEEAPEAQPLTMETLRAMAALCEKIMAGQLQPARRDRYFGMMTETYRDGKAAIVLRKSKIK